MSYTRNGHDALYQIFCICQEEFKNYFVLF